jgi:hypothetical protein
VNDHIIMIVTLIAIAILAAIVLAGIMRGTGSRDKSGELNKLRRSGSFWGVRIQAGKCAAMRPFAGRRFTFEEAPNLPLPGCKAWRCSCTYIGVPERRRDERRIHNDRRDVVRLDDDHVERRSFSGRRRGHKAWKDPAD